MTYITHEYKRNKGAKKLAYIKDSLAGAVLLLTSSALNYTSAATTDMDMKPHVDSLSEAMKIILNNMNFEDECLLPTNAVNIEYFSKNIAEPIIQISTIFKNDKDLENEKSYISILVNINALNKGVRASHFQATLEKLENYPSFKSLVPSLKNLQFLLSNNEYLEKIIKEINFIKILNEEVLIDSLKESLICDRKISLFRRIQKSSTKWLNGR